MNKTQVEIIVNYPRCEFLPLRYLRVINGDYGSDSSEQTDTSK